MALRPVHASFKFCSILFAGVALLCSANVFAEEPVYGAKEWKLFEETCTAIGDYLAEGEILIPADILNKAEIGDHFETINLDRPDTKTAFGNPDSHRFTAIKGSDKLEKDGGTYGQRNGGGRRLMVPQLSVDFSKAILDCARAGYEKKVEVGPANQQAAAAARQIEMLGSADFKQREAASGALLKSGTAAVNPLVDALPVTRDPEVQTRIRALLQKIQLRAAVDKFRFEHAPVLKIAVLADGRMTMDGKASTMPALRTALQDLSKRKGIVWYYREAGERDAPPIATQVIQAVIDNQLPIRLSSRPDYSDVIGPDGKVSK